jgi:hypothetical protein
MMSFIYKFKCVINTCFGIIEFGIYWWIYGEWQSVELLCGVFVVWVAGGLWKVRMSVVVCIDIVSEVL